MIDPKLRRQVEKANLNGGLECVVAAVGSAPGHGSDSALDWGQPNLRSGEPGVTKRRMKGDEM